MAPNKVVHSIRLLVIGLLISEGLAVQFYETIQNYTGHGPVSFVHSQKIYHPSPHGGNGLGGGAYSSAAFSLGESAEPLTGYGSNSLGGDYSGDLGLHRVPQPQHPVFVPHLRPQNHIPQLPPVFQPDNNISPYPAQTPAASPPPTCQPLYAPCQHNKFRTIDGSCNNLKNPGWGTPNTRYARLLPHRYSDGIHAPPTSVTGTNLPGARLVSIVMFPDNPVPDPVWTLISMQWGQIITHDMSMAMGTTQTKPYAASVQCCSPDGRILIPYGQAPSSCFAIEIPGDDPLFHKYGQMCMSFSRSTTDADIGCKPPHQPQEQIVTVSHYMDASLVYGSTPETAAALRQGFGGRLVVEVRDGRQWPPPAANKSATCETQDDDEPCYRFGDVRANQNPQLTVIQIILLREHNRIADILQHLNPHWDDERIFQEARRILIAEYQHINYAEWLPIFIGTNNMVKHGVLYKTDGYVNDYREDVDPSVLNDHATAAFRYFHSAIQGQLHLIGERREVYGALRLSDFFNRPGVIEEGDNMDKLTRGLSTQNQEEVDPFLTSEITDYLFRNGKPFGRDLRAIDIQRGRDHGLASYNDYREFCGLPRAKHWEDFKDFINPENVQKLSVLYQHPDDVDLVVGASVEAHIKDTLTGPTFLCIMTEQFYRTRVGDRFFYERGDHHGAFTPEQLREIRKSTVSRLLCDNGDHIQTMQPEGFRVISEKNQLVSCQDTRAIPALDLSYWKEDVHAHLSPRIPEYDAFFGKK
ncbi:peroxidase [Halyomorpha halys]|uniref:peroxidase n=1 Tax=Halyomorpha halys TaxID=286706 RepID=UPI0006D4D29E|nr:peroxidase [Halyomorpha halys]